MAWASLRKSSFPKGRQFGRFEPDFDVCIPQDRLDTLSPTAKEQVLYYAYFDRKSNAYRLSSDDDRFCNHASPANTHSESELAVSSRDIGAGEEITCDYREINVILPPEEFPRRLSVSDLYTPLSKAVQELRRRRKDEALCRAVAEFQKSHMPPFLPKEAVAILMRCVISANYEFARFAQLAKMSGLQALPLQIPKDRFFHFNFEKYSKVKLQFHFPNNIRCRSLVDLNRFNGKPFTEIQTFGEIGLLDFHHHLLCEQFPSLVDRIRDNSDWMSEVSKCEPRYLHYLTLAVANGIIFENFIASDSQEKRFLEERVFPSFEKAVELFGVKPLIVRLFSEEDEDDPIWYQYPAELYPLANKLGRKLSVANCNAHAVSS